jgi:hypothetical protein
MSAEPYETRKCDRTPAKAIENNPMGMPRCSSDSRSTPLVKVSAVLTIETICLDFNRPLGGYEQNSTLPFNRELRMCRTHHKSGIFGTSCAPRRGRISPVKWAHGTAGPSEPILSLLCSKSALSKQPDVLPDLLHGGCCYSPTALINSVICLQTGIQPLRQLHRIEHSPINGKVPLDGEPSADARTSRSLGAKSGSWSKVRSMVQSCHGVNFTRG